MHEDDNDQSILCSALTTGQRVKWRYYANNQECLCSRAAESSEILDARGRLASLGEACLPVLGNPASNL